LNAERDDSQLNHQGLLVSIAINLPSPIPQWIEEELKSQLGQVVHVLIFTDTARPFLSRTIFTALAFTQPLIVALLGLRLVRLRLGIN
jgi:F420-0:gamma-glutamyl ligase-like protein